MKVYETVVIAVSLALGGYTAYRWNRGDNNKPGSVKQSASRTEHPAPNVDPQAVAQAIDLIKGHPSAEGMVTSTHGYQIFPGVFVHYVPDQFKEHASCQIEFEGSGPELAKGVRKWRLVLVRRPDMNFLSVEPFFGGETPPRLIKDGEQSYQELKVVESGYAVLPLDAKSAAALSQAKTVKVLHGYGANGEISFTYDMLTFGTMYAAATKLCGH